MIESVARDARPSGDAQRADDRAVDLDRDARRARPRRLGSPGAAGLAVGIEAEAGHERACDEAQARQPVAGAAGDAQPAAPATSRPSSVKALFGAAGDRQLAAEHERRPALLGGAQITCPSAWTATASVSS